LSPGAWGSSAKLVVRPKGVVSSGTSVELWPSTPANAEGALDVDSPRRNPKAELDDGAESDVGG
jgi:hypothetical protein